MGRGTGHHTSRTLPRPKARYPLSLRKGIPWDFAHPCSSQGLQLWPPSDHNWIAQGPCGWLRRSLHSCFIFHHHKHQLSTSTMEVQKPVELTPKLKHDREATGWQEGFRQITKSTWVGGTYIWNTSEKLLQPPGFPVLGLELAFASVSALPRGTSCWPLYLSSSPLDIEAQTEPSPSCTQAALCLGGSW